MGIHSNANESPSEAEVHFKNSQLGFPILNDSQAQIANAFGAIKTPHAYLVDPQGKVIYQGGVDDSNIADHAKNFFLRDAIESLLKGKPILVSETRTLGCRIARP